MSRRARPRDVAAALRTAGCVAADDEADELIAAARDARHLEELVDRRVGGEPLAWVTGRTTFAGIELRVDPGVYVPRWQTEAIARRGAQLLPDEGTAIDLCTGSGAVAAVLRHHRPNATIVATDIDGLAVACARSNAVDARRGDLDDAVPSEWRGRVDVVTAVPPYVPTDALALLARTAEPLAALDGGDRGLAVIRRVIAIAPGWLRQGGALLVELGSPQLDAASDALAAAALALMTVLRDPDGDVCGIEAVYGNAP